MLCYSILHIIINIVIIIIIIVIIIIIIRAVGDEFRFQLRGYFIFVFGVAISL